MKGEAMYPDVPTLVAQARIDQWLREAVQDRLVAQARAGRRHAQSRRPQLSGVAA
jgi:hypothetical protein